MVSQTESVSEIHIVPSFHYDVAYLKTVPEYLEICFKNIHKALEILQKEPDYRFLIEQVFLIRAYVEKFPQKKAALKKAVRENRLEIAPGMYVMPDMNLPSGESLYQQVKYGKRWLKETLDYEPRVSWIADCWGHHAQIPQILGQAGYDYYVFWRTMNRDLLKTEFLWEGLDGSKIKTHWLAWRGYSWIRFPDASEVINAADLNLSGCSPDQIRALVKELAPHSTGSSLLLTNGGDNLFPQESAPKVLKELNAPGANLPKIRFSTPSEFLNSVKWDDKKIFRGEFNSSLQGTFTTHIEIKQKNAEFTNELTALETLAVVLGKSTPDLQDTWELLLKQQFHDIIAGSISDPALDESISDFRLLEKRIQSLYARLESSRGTLHFFNPLSFERREIVEQGDSLYETVLPPLGFAPITSCRNLSAGKKKAKLPLTFENEFYRAVVGENGFIRELYVKGDTENLVAPGPAPFGSLAMQMDYGDVWLNFVSPISGGSRESALTQNDPDPYHRGVDGELVNNGTFQPRNVSAEILVQSPDLLLIKQKGEIGFWEIRVPFETRILFTRFSPRIEYRTTILPRGKHFRLRAAFPTTIAKGKTRREIPFGIQDCEPGEHPAQNWMDHENVERGLALLNRGIPSSNVASGVLLLTLFRSVAMEYKCASRKAFGEGASHSFEYAILPHGGGADTLIVQNGKSFNTPPVPFQAREIPEKLKTFHTANDNVFFSALRFQGSDIFLRLYESVGKPTKVRLSLPANVEGWAATDGIERPLADFAACGGELLFELKPFEIKGLLFKVKAPGLSKKKKKT